MSNPNPSTLEVMQRCAQRRLDPILRKQADVEPTVAKFVQAMDTLVAAKSSEPVDVVLARCGKIAPNYRPTLDAVRAFAEDYEPGQIPCCWWPN